MVFVRMSTPLNTDASAILDGLEKIVIVCNAKAFVCV